VIVNCAHVEVLDPAGKVVPTQVDPIFTNPLGDIASDRFKVQ